MGQVHQVPVRSGHGASLHTRRAFCPTGGEASQNEGEHVDDRYLVAVHCFDVTFPVKGVAEPRECDCCGVDLTFGSWGLGEFFLSFLSRQAEKGFLAQYVPGVLSASCAAGTLRGAGTSWQRKDRHVKVCGNCGGSPGSSYMELTGVCAQLQACAVTGEPCKPGAVLAGRAPASCVDPPRTAPQGL